MIYRRGTAAATPALILVGVVIATLAAGATPALAADAPVTVTITGGLAPATLEIPPGTVVVWTNDDTRRHRVRARRAPQRFDSGNLEPGETFSFAFAEEGTYPYIDERNEDDPRYAGTITVTASADGGEPPPPPAAPDATTPTPNPADPAAAATDVTILDRSFSPASVSVPAGAAVLWTNSSDRDHTVTFTGEVPSSDVLARGATFRQTFSTPGTFAYVCAIHSEMTGSVTVTDGPGSDGGGSVSQQGVGGIAALDAVAASSAELRRALPPWVLPVVAVALVAALGAAVAGRRLAVRRRAGRTS